jgi:hypothetical protein
MCEVKNVYDIFNFILSETWANLFEIVLTFFENFVF